MDLFEYRLRPISAIMYLQDAFARFCATKKMAAYDLFSTNQYWVVAEFNIDFIDNLPFWSEEIGINIWISEITKLKIYTDYEITYKNKPFAKGNALWFIIDKESKRPAKTDVVADRFNIIDDLVLGEHKKFILPEAKEKVSEIKHTNNLSDLDFNQHVNNKSYINLAEMTFNNEFRKTHTLKSLHIRFNRETFLGDTLICSTYQTDTENTYTHVIEKDGVSVCDVITQWADNNVANDIVNYNLDVKNEK
jgi:medium-chain acyl-[acyl-carrier-protein] hydrolase